jgi:hypothetical protein
VFLIPRYQHVSVDICPLPKLVILSGVAYMNVFGVASYQDYSPALVYYDNLGSEEDLVAEAASHEVRLQTWNSVNAAFSRLPLYKGWSQPRLSS